MDYLVTASTDVGRVKQTNEDSLFVRILRTPTGKMVMAVLCDGMGGLSKGEVASASVLEAFSNWMYDSLPELSRAPLEDSIIRQQWEAIVTEQNRLLAEYGRRIGASVGTTVTVFLTNGQRYYIMNVGDGRIYEIGDTIKQLTRDQTVVANEVAQGIMTWEEAEADPRRNVLLQCVGASEVVSPDFFFGEPLSDAVYMLCSDGFRHMVGLYEFHAIFHPSRINSVEAMKARSDELIRVNMERGEEDNISVITIRTFQRS